MMMVYGHLCSKFMVSHVHLIHHCTSCSFNVIYDLFFVGDAFLII